MGILIIPLLAAAEVPQMIELSRAMLRLIFDLNVDWTVLICTPNMSKD